MRYQCDGVQSQRARIRASGNMSALTRQEMEFGLDVSRALNCTDRVNKTSFVCASDSINRISMPYTAYCLFIFLKNIIVHFVYCCPAFDSASNRNENQESSWDNDRQARKANNLTAICEPIV
jgi:hypothetical protein